MTEQISQSDQGPWLQERVGGGVGAMAVPKKGRVGGKGWVGTHKWTGGQGGGARAPGGGCKGFGSGGVSGRGGNTYKKKKNVFF